MATIKTKQTAEDLAAEAIKILANLRFRTKAWETQFGAQSRNNKKLWESKADDMLNKLGIKEDTAIINIEIDL